MTLVRSGSTLASNAAANAVRVASSSLTSVLLPLALVSLLAPRFYAFWAVLFGTSAVVLYLDLGLPTSVQTLVARASLRDPTKVRGIGRTGVLLSSAVALVVLLVSALLSAHLSGFYPALARFDAAQAVGVLILLVSGNGATLISNTASCYFTGLQRGWTSTALLVPGRLVSFAAAVVAASTGADLLVVAAAYAMPLLLGAAIISLRLWGETRTSGPSALVDLELIRFSAPLIAWSAFQVVISSIGIVLIGRFDFAAVSVFAVAAALAAALAGLQGAVLIPVLSDLGRSFGSGDRSRTDRMVRNASAFNGSLIFFGVAAIICAYPLLASVLHRGQGGDSVADVALVTLVVAAAGVRLVVAVLNFSFIVSGAHSRLIAPPGVETAMTVVACVVLGVAFGALGVGAGLLVGAITGVALALTWSYNLARSTRVPRRELFFRGAALPALCTLPLDLAGVFQATAHPAWALTVFVITAGAALSLVALWWFALPTAFKMSASQVLARRSRA